MDEVWTLESIRHGRLIEIECDSFREAVITAWHEINWNHSTPVRIVCPDGSIVVRDERHTFPGIELRQRGHRSRKGYAEGTIEAFVYQYYRQRFDD